MLSIFIKISFRPNTPLSIFHCSHFLFNFLISFVQIIWAWSRCFPILLFSLDPVQIRVLTQAFIYFMFIWLFFVLSLIEAIRQIMGTGSRQGFHYFDMIVHVETLFSFVSIVFLTFFLLCIFALVHLLDGIQILTNRIVLCIVPWYIGMMIILIHGSRGDQGSFRVFFIAHLYWLKLLI